MGERKSISKKLRFEVFKRDSFTCQYCGRMAPDVILEVDHINPVAKGGKNDILNLITSCRECNRGKGAKSLSENQIIKQQQEQLKEINEKREQLKLLLKWKQELEDFENEQVKIIDDLLKAATKCGFSDYGRENIKKTIKRYGISEVIEATKISITQYNDGSEEGIDKAFNYIPRICAVRERQLQDPWDCKRKYIRGIIRNRLSFSSYNYQRLDNMLKDLVDCQERYEDICYIAKNAQNWDHFWDWINDSYELNY